MATLYDLQIKLAKVNSFIGDITNVHYFRVKFNDILEKYTGDEVFVEDLKAIVASRNGYQKILTKYDAIKVKLQRQLSGIPMPTPEVEAAPTIEEVVAPIEEVVTPVVEVPIAKKSKKSKKSKR